MYHNIPQRRTIRVTRSQSRDMSESDIENGRLTRGSQRTSREVSTESYVGRRVRSNRIRIGQELPTVSEKSDIIYPNLGENVDAVPIGEAVNQDRGETNSLSNVSTPSSEESVILDSQAMLDALPDLYEAAHKLLSFLTPQSDDPDNNVRFIQDLQDHSNGAIKKLLRLKKALQLHKEPYGNETYVNLMMVLRELLQVRRTVDIGHGAWRPDDILYKANLAIAATNLLLPQGDSVNNLENLDRDYPGRFFSQSSHGLSEFNKPLGSSTLFKRNLQLGLDIRTQYLISLLDRHSREPNFDPELMLSQVFFEDVDDARLKGWDCDGMREVGSTSQHRITTRIENIQNFFEEDSQGVSVPALYIDQLRAKYPWSRFVASALSWVNLRWNEIEVQITSSGGLEKIEQAVRDEIADRSVPDGKQISSGNEVAQNNVQLTLDPASQQLRYESEQAHAAERAHTAKQAGVADQDVVNELPTPTERVSSSIKQSNPASKRTQKVKGDLSSASTTRALRDIIANATAKRNTLQPQVTRGQNSKDLDASNRVGRQDITTKSNTNGKNSITYEEITFRDGIQDGFQFQTEQDDIFPDEDPVSTLVERSFVPEDASVRHGQRKVPLSHDHIKKQKVLVHLQGNATRSRFGTHESESPRSQMGSAREERQEDRTTSPSEDDGFQKDSRSGFSQHRNPLKSKSRDQALSSTKSSKRPRAIQSESVELGEERSNAAQPQSNVGPPSQSQIYREINRQSKTATALNAPKPVQSRQAWSKEETQRLIELIEEYGTSWALLKRKDEIDGNILERRGQVALKDKARNMKFDYRNAQAEEPYNFEKVKMTKMQNDRLRAIGKQPDDDED